MQYHEEARHFGHGQRGRGRGGGSRRGGGRSLLVVRMVEPAILTFLSQGEAHGYTLLEKLESLGLVDLHPSMVYRLLRQMESNGWITSDWEEKETQGPPRRVYRLTEEGLGVLKFWSDQLKLTENLIKRLFDQMNFSAEEESSAQGAGSTSER